MRRIIFFFAVITFFTQNSFAQSFSGIGASVGTNILIAETKLTESARSPNFGLHGLLDFSENLSLKFQTGYGQLGIDSKNSNLITSFIPVELLGMISPLGKAPVSPFLHVGFGAISFTQNGSRYYDGLLIGGGGLTAGINDQFSFLVSTDLRYTTSDQFNGITNGLYDGYLNIQIGLTYNLLPQKAFERKPKFNPKDIIAVNTEPDPVLEIVEMQSKINILKKEIAVKDEQIRQIMSQIQTRQDRIDKIETEIANLSEIERESDKLTATQRITTQNIIETKQLSDSQVRFRYNQAQALIQSKQYNRAISELEGLFRNSSNHPLQSNFIYWIGECYFALGNYSNALNSFRKVSQFNQSPKLDDALIMSGLSLMKLGDLQNASKKFRELIQEHPDSEYISKATKYLQTVERQIIS